MHKYKRQIPVDFFMKQINLDSVRFVILNLFQNLKRNYL